MSGFVPSSLAEHDLLAAVDHVIEEVLRRHALASPPVDANLLLAQEGEKVLPKRRVRDSKESNGGSMGDSAELERQRAAALALGKSLNTKILNQARIGPRERSSEAEAQLAGLFATRLLMPTSWFQEDVRRLGYNLPRLHARYATASIASVAWRLLDLNEPAVVTIFDNNHIVDRRSNLANSEGTPEIDAAERAAQAYAHQFSRARLEHSPALTARAWPLHRADWRREIVVARLDDVSFDIDDCQD